jgi:3-oxoacyl-[acyl-carrier protein] reductase
MEKKILYNKIALITGATGGLGEAMAGLFAREGAKVVVHYFKSREKALAIVKNIELTGGDAIAVYADVSSYPQVAAMIDEVNNSFGKIDILINNAGITKDRTLQNMDENDWDEVIKVNLKGVFNCCKLTLPYMTKQKCGRIINISALAGEIGNFGQSNYAASKSAIFGFSKSLAKELAKFNITVNVISPGLIDTVLLNTIPEKAMTNFINRIPLGRLGSPMDVANAALFLSSDGAGYITGQIIAVNGGLQ